MELQKYLPLVRQAFSPTPLVNVIIKLIQRATMFALFSGISLHIKLNELIHQKDSDAVSIIISPPMSSPLFQHKWYSGLARHQFISTIYRLSLTSSNRQTIRCATKASGGGFSKSKPIWIFFELSSLIGHKTSLDCSYVAPELPFLKHHQPWCSFWNLLCSFWHSTVQGVLSFFLW